MGTPVAARQFWDSSPGMGPLDLAMGRFGGIPADFTEVKIRALLSDFDFGTAVTRKDSQRNCELCRRHANQLYES